MTASDSAPPRISICGECAVTVEFAERIDRRTNVRVQRLAAALPAHLGSAAIRALIPAYRSLLVRYDPWICSYERLCQVVEDCLAAEPSGAGEGAPAGRRLEIPVCYGGAYGPDLEALAAARGLTPQEAAALHSAADYCVYMIGFTPGYCYLGGLDERLATPRRKEPRLQVPAGSVGIAERQTGIYSIASPGGWQIVGRTPLVLFAPQRGDPFLLRPGDSIRFRPISTEEFEDARRS